MEMLDKVHGCFLGIMVGDAIGAPVEMMKPKDILAQNDGKPIDGFDHQVRRKQFKQEVVKIIDSEPAKHNVSLFGEIFRKLNIKLPFNKTHTSLPVMVLEATPEVVHGSTTDDWQLTNVLCKSLVRMGKFDLTDIALAHVNAYETNTSGWGGTTRNSMKELQEYFESLGLKGRSPSTIPTLVPGKGSGNGIAMKIAPLALMHVMCGVDWDKLITQVADVGRMTHSDPRAWAAAYALTCMYVEIDRRKFGNVTDHKMLLNDVIQHLSTFERKYGSGGKRRFSSYLKVLLDESLLFGPIETLRDKVGTGCIAIESVVFAIALFLRNRNDFRTAVLEAVNAGGDADTVASMVGGLIGFLVGPSEIPSDWRYFSPNFADAKQAANQICTTFDNKHASV